MDPAQNTYSDPYPQHWFYAIFGYASVCTLKGRIKTEVFQLFVNQRILQLQIQLFLSNELCKRCTDLEQVGTVYFILYLYLPYEDGQIGHTIGEYSISIHNCKC